MVFSSSPALPYLPWHIPGSGPGWLVLPGIVLFLAGLRMAKGHAQGLLYGAIYGLIFFGGLIWWLSSWG